MKCDHCGKFSRAADLVSRPVTQADYLFGDSGPYYDFSGCLSASTE